MITDPACPCMHTARLSAASLAASHHKISSRLRWNWVIPNKFRCRWKRVLDVDLFGAVWSHPLCVNSKWSLIPPEVVPYFFQTRALWVRHRVVWHHRAFYNGCQDSLRWLNEGVVRPPHPPPRPAPHTWNQYIVSQCLSIEDQCFTQTNMKAASPLNNKPARTPHTICLASVLLAFRKRQKNDAVDPWLGQINSPTFSSVRLDLAHTKICFLNKTEKIGLYKHVGTLPGL